MRPLVPAVACLLAAGCATKNELSPPLPTPRTEARPWAAVSYSPSGPPAYLGNSTLGIRLNAFGSGGGLPAFGMFQDALAACPNPCEYEISVAGTRLGDHLRFYKSWLDFKTGVFSVSWKQEIGGAVVQVKVETVCHPKLAAIGQRISLLSDRPLSGLTIRFGSPAADMPTGSISRYEANAPISLVSELEIPHPPSGQIGGSIRISEPWEPQSVQGGYLFQGTLGTRPLVVDRVCWIGGWAWRAATFPSQFEQVAAAERDFLRERWHSDIEVDGPVEDQQAIRSFLFYLYTSATRKMPPMALSNARYKGHRFWDAEAWLLPVYAVVWPHAAWAATEWRLNVSSKSARIPWEQSATGADVTPREFASALHAGGWVFWWLERAKALGLCDTARANPLETAIAQSFINSATKRHGRYEIEGVISPDEGRKRNNDLVTNLLAKFAAQTVGGRPGAPAYFRDFAAKLALPTAQDGLPATYDNDTHIRYQQSAAVLALYPLEWPFSEQTKSRMFDRYKDKVSSAGPAMSDSIHAVVAARLGRNEEAYKFWLDSWQPFVRRETMQFCERRGSDASYFATGAAGCLQTVIFGLLGVRMGEVPAGSDMKPFTVKPCLPQSWRSITFRGAHLPGGPYTIRATPSGVSIDKEDNN